MSRLEIRPGEGAGELGLYAEGDARPLVTFHPPSENGRLILDLLLAAYHSAIEQDRIAADQGFPDRVAWWESVAKDQLRIEFLEASKDPERDVGLVLASESPEGSGLILAQPSVVPGEPTVREAIDVAIGFATMKAARAAKEKGS